MNFGILSDKYRGCQNDASSGVYGWKDNKIIDFFQIMGGKEVRIGMVVDLWVEIRQHNGLTWLGFIKRVKSGTDCALVNK